MKNFRRILIVSLGSIGRRHFKNLVSLYPQSEISVFRTKKKLTGNKQNLEYKEVYTLDEAINFRADLVVIASPASLHVSHILSLSTGANFVFVEKPLAASLADAEKLLTLSDEQREKISVGYVLRHQPFLSDLRSLIKSGFLGSVYAATIETGQYLPFWRPDADYRKGVSAQRSTGGGVLLELSHEIDYAIWLFGEPNSIFAQVGNYSDLEIDVEDNASLLLHYPDKRVSVNVDFLQKYPRMTLKVIGANGCIEADLIKEQAFFLNENGKTELKLEKTPDFNEIYLKQFKTIFSYGSISAQDSDRLDSFANIEDAILVLKVIDAAKKSANIGKRIDF